MARETADERPRWVRALQRSMIADTGKSLGAPPPFAYGKDSSVGLSQAVKTVAPCARVRAWSRGDATTAVVTQAWRVGSRWKHAFGSPLAPDA